MTSRTLIRATLPVAAAALAACSFAAPATGPAPAGRAPVGAGATDASITPADLRLRLGIVAHDSMQGRDVGTPGIRRAADYIIRDLQRLGLRPAGDNGTWLDQVDLVRTRTSATVTHRGQALTSAQVVPVGGTAGLPPGPRLSGQGTLAYGGWVVDPQGGPALTAEQLAGRVLILRLGAAPGTPEGQPQPRYNVGQLLGPGSPLAGLVLVAEGSLDEFWEYAQKLALNGDVSPAGGDEPAAGNSPMVFLASPQAVEGMIRQPMAQARQSMADLGPFAYQVRRDRAAIEAFNVVAMLPGSDARLAGEYVAIGSHYDHDGIGPAVNGDSIYNGADDDGSGTVAMLEIAERLAASPPRRSVLFVWHTAEEKGLLGSEQFTREPTVPRESIVAQLNIDMIGRNSADSVFLVGSRRLSTQLGDAVEAVNRRQDRPFAFDYSWDVPDHPERIYCRSDHYNYARYGIPVTFFTTGLHPEYHKPQDEVQLIDYDKLARVTRLISDVAVEVAGMAQRPAVDKPVPPLGTPCT